VTPVLTTAVLAAAALWFAVPPGALRRTASPGVSTPTTSGADDAPPRRWLWSALAGLGAGGFVSGWPGLAAGVLAACAVWVVLGRSETPARRRRRERIRADLPHVVGLLAASVHSGLPPADALALVCTALPGPAADVLAALPPRIALGMAPAEVWGSIASEPALAPLGRTLARSARTGEPVAEALERLGRELAARSRAEVEDAARRVGVQAAVPLGLCLLPAFLLVGVVPVVAGLVGALGG
jgi:Flp pilus assembly protein TadB